MNTYIYIITDKDSGARIIGEIEDVREYLEIVFESESEELREKLERFLDDLEVGNTVSAEKVGKDLGLTVALEV